MAEDIKNYKELKELLSSENSVFLLLYKSGSEQSDCARERLEKVKNETMASLCFADVNLVRDIHSRFNVSSAPSLLEFRQGELKNVFKGCQSENFYLSALTGKKFAIINPGESKNSKRVIVYTAPTCTWCNTIKTYFREKNISFTEVDVSSNPSRAEEMVKKSGQQGVPQTDINGQVVVGFDKNRINQLLEIN